jgi:hypothetical protein
MDAGRLKVVNGCRKTLTVRHEPSSSPSHLNSAHQYVSPYPVLMLFEPGKHSSYSLTVSQLLYMMYV